MLLRFGKLIYNVLMFYRNFSQDHISFNFSKFYFMKWTIYESLQVI